MQDDDLDTRQIPDPGYNVKPMNVFVALEIKVTLRRIFKIIWQVEHSINQTRLKQQLSTMRPY